MKYLKSIRSHSATIRLITVVSAAAGLAWLAGSLLFLSQPAVGAVACVLTVQTTTHLSLRTGLVRLIATAAGLGIALVMFHYAGVDTLSVIAVVAVSMLVGWLLGLGEEGTRIVPATSLFMFVLGGALTGTLIWQDFAATLLGVALGAVASVLAQPESATTRADAQLTQLSDAIADLLAALANGTRQPYTTAQADAWLATARHLVTPYAAARQAVSDAAAHANFASATTRTQVARLRSTLLILQYSIDQVIAIARALYDGALADTEVPSSLGDVLDATASAFSAHADSSAPALDAAKDAITTSRAESISSLHRFDDTGMWLLSGSILADVDRMVDQLSGSSPAMAVADPAHSLTPPSVVPIPPSLTRLTRKRQPPT